MSTTLNIILCNRKFWLVVGGLALTFIEGVIKAFWDKFPLEAVFVANAGLIGAYLGVNIIQKIKANNGKNTNCDCK